LRLYHWTYYNFLRSLIIILLSAVFFGCTAPQVTQDLITINLNADKKDVQIKMASGSTVQEALKQAQIILGEMDRVEPPIYTVLSDGSNVKVIRIREEYYIEQEIIPFEHQELRNEALPEGERRLSQPGVNGLEEITYHRVYEDDLEVSNNIVKSIVLEAAIPEVVMIGSRSSFASINIPGKIIFLSAGNAWIIEESTANRQLVVSTGDLDGRIFSLSKDGKFMLFTRFSKEESSINSLWVASLQSDPARLIDLGVKDVVHFAEFDPSSTIVAYSTVEWRETAPGWQANNNLYVISVSSSGIIGKPKLLLESNSGGVYGWWGTEFSWAPDGESLLYSRPDGIGIFDIESETMTSIYNVTPYQTGGNWAWVPESAWSPDGKVIYSVDHIPSDDLGTQESQGFDLIAIPLTGGSVVRMVERVGMFALPMPSPMEQRANFINTMSGTNLYQNAFFVAYLQAIFPDQSETSGYRLTNIDRDGSNKMSLFPEEGAIGLDPQLVVWSPEPMSMEDSYTIAFIYNGNIWFVDTNSGVPQQITGDGLSSKIDWR
jgi:hypothetical protein